jgi:hypothetical protein
MTSPARLLLPLFLVIGLASCDVAAVDWGPVTSTYDGRERVRGHGTFANEGYRRAVNRSTFRDSMPNDGNTVYVRTSIRWWKYRPVSTNPRWDWVNGTSKTTPEISSGSYQTHAVGWDLDPDGSKARAEPKVCAQMGWPVPDSCGNGGVPTFDY